MMNAEHKVLEMVLDALRLFSFLCFHDGEIIILYIGGKYKARILWALHKHGTMRYGELGRETAPPNPPCTADEKTVIPCIRTDEASVNNYYHCVEERQICPTAPTARICTGAS